MIDDDTIQLAAFELPPSSLLTTESRRALTQWRRRVGTALASCPFDKSDPYEPRHVPAIRQSLQENLWPTLIADYRRRYDVQIEPTTINGVNTEVITTTQGISPQNQTKVLINLHSGGFEIGGRYAGQVESIPMAALGKLKVVSIDYRMAPEHEFPAATHDVVTVYRDLLRRYDAPNIGIYGTSAGAVLTAQTVAQLLRDQLPLPGAIGMFCGAAAYWTEGDSGHLAAALGAHPFAGSRTHPYFKNTDPDDPSVFPLRSPDMLAKFPPSLLISSTRDQALSSVVHTHSKLIAANIDSDLHIWEGLGHAFFYEPTLPESQEMYRVTAQFFDQRLK